MLWCKSGAKHSHSVKKASLMQHNTIHIALANNHLATFKNSRPCLIIAIKHTAFIKNLALWAVYILCWMVADGASTKAHNRAYMIIDGECYAV